jgi:hypothetical protein
MFKLIFTTVFAIFVFLSFRIRYYGIAEEGPPKKVARYLYRVSIAVLAATGIFWAMILCSIARLYIFGPALK